MDRTCPKCQEDYEVVYLTHSYCPPCMNAYKRANRKPLTKEQKRKRRNLAYQYKYGITIDRYEQLLEDQEYTCKLCDHVDDPSSGLSRLAVDHCHDTGQVRGLLCSNCNTAIGKLGDNIEGLTRALNYLKGD